MTDHVNAALRLVAVGVIASVALTACTSSHTEKAVPSTKSSTTATAPSATSRSSAASSPSSTGTVAAARTTSGSAVLVADPANYHLGSTGALGKVRRDAQAVSFQTPSRNIRCTLLDRQNLICMIVEHSFAAAPRPSDCTHNWLGSDITLTTGGAEQGVCAGDPFVLENSTVLAYGYRLTVGPISCLSRQTALECRAGSHGFVLSRTAAALH